MVKDALKVNIYHAVSISFATVCLISKDLSISIKLIGSEYIIYKCVLSVIFKFL